MKIAIVGAGIVGVATAYELAHDGHEVTVFDRHTAAAEGASFAPAGLMGPGLLHDWSHPCLTQPGQWLGLWAQVRGRQSLQDWLWRRQWRRHAQQGTSPVRAIEALARFGRERLEALTLRHGLELEAATGRLLLLRTEAELRRWEPVLQQLRDSGVPVRQIDAATAREREPGLSPEAPLALALELPDALTANCRLAAHQLRQHAQALGADFRFQSQVLALRAGTGIRPQLQVRAAPAAGQTGGSGPAAHQSFEADAVIVCAGADAAHLLRPLGLRLPLAAVAGYTVSAPLRDPLHAPLGSVIDGAEQLSISRLGQRVRISGGAEMGGAPADHHQPTVARLYRMLNHWFPGGAQLRSGVQVWRGVRPLLPDGAPLIAAGGPPGVWLNLGHGANGWALACGAARGLADQLAHQPGVVDLAPFALRRF
ncbi:MAG: FAD-dependent oxidoreductase [Burkholderiaceae bacterium]